MYKYYQKVTNHKKKSKSLIINPYKVPLMSPSPAFALANMKHGCLSGMEMIG